MISFEAHFEPRLHGLTTLIPHSASISNFDSEIDFS
jgi:hypothetical protein